MSQGFPKLVPAEFIRMVAGLAGVIHFQDRQRGPVSGDSPRKWNVRIAAKDFPDNAGAHIATNHNAI